MTGYANVNGLKLYYEEHGLGRKGEDRPLVLLPGGILTIPLTFDTVLPALVTDRRVIAVELQGHGHTADIDREPTIPNLASDVVGLLDELGVDRADLLGFSLGGGVALELAVTHPDRVGDLVVASAPHRWFETYYPEIRTADPNSPRMPTAKHFAQMRESYRLVAPDPDHFDDFLMNQSAVVAAFEGWTDEQIATITARTLLICGDTDFMPVAAVADTQRLIPGAQLAVLPNTTHMDVMHRTELIVALLREFCAPGR
jgi:pimeloyl-ACP methyl ester carboxylesterase